MNIRLLFFTLFLVTTAFFSVNCSRIVSPNSLFSSTKQNVTTNALDADDQDMQDSLTNDNEQDDEDDDYQDDEDEELLFRPTWKTKARHFTRLVKQYTGTIIAASTTIALMYMYWHKVWLFAPKNAIPEKKQSQNNLKEAEQKPYEPYLAKVEQEGLKITEKEQKIEKDSLKLLQEKNDFITKLEQQLKETIQNKDEHAATLAKQIEDLKKNKEELENTKNKLEQDINTLKEKKQISDTLLAQMY